MSAEQHQLQHAATAAAEQRAAAVRAEKAAAAQARAAQLRRRKQDNFIEGLFGFDEDAHEEDGCSSGSDDAAEKPQRPRSKAGSTRAAATPQPDHGQRRLRYELNARQHVEQGVAYRTMFSSELAAQQEADQAQWLATLQQRVQGYVSSGALHPECSAHGVKVVSWRKITVRNLLGSGVLTIPVFRWGGDPRRWRPEKVATLYHTWKPGARAVISLLVTFVCCLLWCSPCPAAATAAGSLRCTQLLSTASPAPPPRRPRGTHGRLASTLECCSR